MKNCTFDEKIAIFKQLISGLYYLHAYKKCIHRDLKPNNLMIKTIENNNHNLKYQLKIIDFDSNKEF